MQNKNALRLKLFNSVLSEQSNSDHKFLPEYGVYVPGDAVYAVDEIKTHLSQLKLSGQDLNKTFYKSWEKIQNSSRLQLAIDQIMHCMSTYGTNHEGEAYIPDGVLEIPGLKLKFSVIDTLSQDEVITKCLDLLCSGIALTEDTLKETFVILESFGYKFTGEEGIRNKEANILIADKYQIYPKSPEEFLRYVLFKTTESTSLVKSKEIIAKIKASRTDVSKMFKEFGETNLAPVFNRFKPLFLAFKSAHDNNSKVINKISKLSKTLHKPMLSNPVNQVTFIKLVSEDTHWLNNATVYALFKALSACYSRMKGQDTFAYRIRNGKSWFAENAVNVEVCTHNYNFILFHLKTRIKGEGKTVFIPNNVVYALPTSEKLFVGNIPTGTKFLGERLAAGIYWENSWGAVDLDLSGLNIGGKIGWNADYHDDDRGLTYSGDLQDAPEGAVEYLHVDGGSDFSPTLVMNNVYNGDDNSEYKIIVGEGPDVTRAYMMDPNNLIAEVKTASVQNNTVLGMIIPEQNGLDAFVLLNFGAGNARVSGSSKVSMTATKALYQQWNNPLSLAGVLIDLGFDVLREKPDENKAITVDFNLEIDKLSKSTFIDLFK